MNYNKDFSIIIPHRNSVELLPTLFKTIPNNKNIEIIVIDNSTPFITKNDIGINRDYTLIFSAPERGAGGARNEGLKIANGKWIIFIDADDYFTENAWKAFYQFLDSDCEIIHFKEKGVFIDTGEMAPQRGRNQCLRVDNFLKDKSTEWSLRLQWNCPVCRMIKLDLIKRNNIKFDEVIASNDVMFALLAGFYAKKVDAFDEYVYVATVNKGSLTRRRDYDVILSRFLVTLRYNKFLKEHGFPQFQNSIMNFYSQSINFGFKAWFYFTKLLLQYKQNPFIGISRWKKTYTKRKSLLLKEKQYIVK